MWRLGSWIADPASLVPDMKTRRERRVRGNRFLNLHGAFVNTVSTLRQRHPFFLGRPNA
jgi:hypothetical protein